ncbi:TetR/AcrR family transcriptional regulator [Mycolicibacterium wolinskyi]|uniref:TetR/AcrR family transcriptional regulator n=1 Tax=Mycolicibacterium wolinskyi TaxID=59750 RepID=UPI003917A05A
MGDTVKRPYRSELRAAQAAETRRAVVAAAARLFVEHGYRATTIDAVAAAAGVSRKTVFSSAGGKVDLLKLAVDWAVAGDDQPVGLADRDPITRLFDLDDPVRLLRGWARLLADIDVRTARLFRAVEIAADEDPDAAGLLAELHRQRLSGARRVVKHLRERNALTAHRRPGDAVDVAWLATDPVLFDRLVRERGWTVRRFADWLGETLIRELLG